MSNEAPAPNQRWEHLAKESGYRASELAGLCGVSLRTLQRHFSTHYKLKVSQWLRSIRLRDAYSKLTAGESVKQVAYSMGYKQLSHFSRDFKKYFGVKPSLLSPLREFHSGEEEEKEAVS